MERILIDFIFKIYFSISTILLTTQYLASCIILAIANIDVTWFNNFIFKMIRKKYYLFKSIDKIVNSTNRKTILLESFYQIYKLLLSPHIF